MPQMRKRKSFLLLFSKKKAFLDFAHAISRNPPTSIVRPPSFTRHAAPR
jgi:hypothetical protein